jgi:hypothetical protein
MASIKISDLHVAGSDLFSASESYMNEVSEGELNIRGGILPLLLGIAVGIAISEYYHHH